MCREGEVKQGVGEGGGRRGRRPSFYGGGGGWENEDSF